MLMYYHILIESRETDKKGKNNSVYIESDNESLDRFEKNILIPFHKKERINIDGYFVEPGDVKRMVVKCSSISAKDWVVKKQKEFDAKNGRGGIYMIYSYRVQNALESDDFGEVINDQVLADVADKVDEKVDAGKTLKRSSAAKLKKSKRAVFIVHGHDDGLKNTVARFITDCKLDPIILHEQVNQGRTLIEKFEYHSDVGFAIILYTPCDLGAAVAELESVDGTKQLEKLKGRARQNVIFEHGYFIGRLGRENVCAIIRKGVEQPSDLSGIVYIAHDQADAWKVALMNELTASGYEIDFNVLKKH